ncbi:hypothetical protein [Mycobacteroides chelonae]|uniref:hypothetical protein n=1 Tax=Mycobacteroides chelonae TaxID=1774 RepID=UPI0008A953A0|nr:hypothetical protein [Mycobacteroides chelonae]OHT54094.1 hypothetical protein BKG63_07415 [Mycobacteroides chelonae]OHT99867.1 hypothetical protein BKG72_05730 [Mycobacteroides chelonae]OLT86553.1 hypothetical protein BKG59_22395 [Mycobacteroides chelonae]
MIAKRRYMRGLPPPASPLAPSGAPAPKVSPDQDELRSRRRKRLPLRYGGTFNLAAEIEAVITQAAQEASRLADPLPLRGAIENVLDAVHESMFVSVSLLSESKASDPNITRRLVADLAARPRLPEISDAQIISGSWVHALAAWTEPYAGDLARLLANAHPPGHDALRGNPSASERVERALRGLDRAVLTLERRIPQIAQRQALPSMESHNRQQRERADAERSERILAKLGASK